MVNWYYQKNNILDKIIKVFRHEKYDVQYTVGPYEINLYFHDHRLAIECSNSSQSDKNPENEKTRENFIKHKLKCTFVRFNPDDANFDIFEVIHQIYNHMKCQ